MSAAAGFISISQDWKPRIMCEHELPLARQMWWAAQVLEAANQHCGMRANMSWTAADLRTEPRVVAAEAGAL